MPEAHCPMPKDAARAMFEQLDYRLPINGTCKDGKHSLHITKDWIVFSPFAARKAQILAWLEGLGGTCDCTVHSVAEPNWRRVSSAQLLRRPASRTERRVMRQPKSLSA